VRTRDFTAHHGLQAGGMINRVEFGADASRALPLNMNDRIHDKQLGQYYLRYDPAPEVEVIGDGPLAVTIRTRARYCKADGSPAPGEPSATYTFEYSALSPVVALRAEPTQHDGPAWSQMHVFEMHHKTPEPFFTDLAFAPALTTMPLVDEKQTHSLRGKQWGALFTRLDALGLISTDLYGIHTNLSGHGVYVHGPWHTFRNGTRRHEATLYLGPSGGSAEALAERMADLSAHWAATVRLPEGIGPGETTRQAREQLEATRALISLADPAAQDDARRLHATGLWLTNAADRAAGSLMNLYRWERLANAAGELAATVEALVAAQRPPAVGAFAYGTDELTVLASDGLLLELVNTDGHMGLRQMARMPVGTDLMADGASDQPLWDLTFRNSNTGELASVGPASARDRQWSVADDGAQATLTMTWLGNSVGDRADALDVTATVTLAEDSSLSDWRLKLTNRSDDWGLWQMDFPRVGPVGPGGQVCVPSKWGRVHDVPFASYRGAYPSQHAFGQLMCWWGENAGVYFGAHDPSAGMKQLVAEAVGNDGTAMAITTYPPDMGVPMAERDLGFDVVIGAHDGDWFDAAKIYRQWAIEQFWCRRGPLSERDEMPQWWRDCSLCIRPTGDPDFVTQMGTNLQAAFDTGLLPGG